MADHPIHECLKSANELLNQGHQVFQKFTCEKCGSRQTVDKPDMFYSHGRCEECLHVTDLRLKGCNYLAILRIKR
jgi:ribosomal protein L40E